MKNRQWLLARRPHGAIQDSDFQFVDTDAPTPGEGEGHCHINRFYCSLLASPLDSEFNKFNGLASRQGAAREPLLARCDNAQRGW